LYSDGQAKDVTTSAVFSSADRATVDLNGSKAVGVREGGPVTITATFGGLSATAQIRVSAAALSWLEVLIVPPFTGVLQQGEQGQLQAIGHYSDGTTRDVTTSSTWTSSDYGIVSVAAGTVTGIGAGRATITATSGGLTGTITILVEVPTLEHLAIVPPNAVLRPNLIYPFRAYATYSDGRVVEVPQLVEYWTVDNASVAQVINYGNYFGLWAMDAPGTPIHVSYDGSMGHSQIQVLLSNITGTEVSPSKLILPTGMAAKLSGVFAYKSAGDGWAVEIQNPDWSSNNTSIVRVGTNGVASAVSPGATTIQMTTYDGPSGNMYVTTTDVQVTSTALQAIELDVPPRMVVGLSAKVHAIGVFSDGTRMDLGPSPIFWGVSSSSLASISPEVDGAKVTAKAAGNLTVSATLNGVVQTKSVTLVATTLSTLEFGVAQTTLPQGSTSRVDLIGHFADGTSLDLTESATYESLAPDVAQVVNGLFTNMPRPMVLAHEPNQAPADATLRASFGGVSATTSVRVNGANLRSLEVAVGSAAPSPSLTLSFTGGPYQLRVIGTFTDNSTADVTPFCTFEPASPGPGIYATISNAQAGKVTMLGRGSQTLRVTYAPTYLGQPLISGTATMIVQ
ncbi:MAG: Ig-like domain-containing protein, partial [Deltaproteobacteria bacterium]|nr:Ig-like domain-containing protein [Deltaproteobacteria bacterium]